MNNDVINEALDWLENEIQSLRKEINTRSETISSLEKLVNDLKSYEDNVEYKEKYAETKKKYEQEKNQIETLEKERNDLRFEIKTWQDWFDSNKELFDRLLNAGPPNTNGKKDTFKQTPVKLPKIKIKR